jgi:predicted MPP superfamily phosphohydrolase
MSKLLVRSKKTPNNMKVLAVGDIHTKLWIIDAVAQKIDDYDAIVFVGDYADDWNSGPLMTIETWKVLKLFQAIHPDKVHLVVGNHDYIYVNKTSTIASGYNYVTQSILNEDGNKKLKLWLSNLPVIKVIDGVTFSHAGITRDYNEFEGYWSDNSPIWARPDERKGPLQYEDKPQVFGHTPSNTCWEVQPNVWCIDTFSTYQDDSPIGDHTALEIIDGKTFTRVKIKK